MNRTLVRGLRAHRERRRIVSSRQQAQRRREDHTGGFQIHGDGRARAVDREAVDLRRDGEIRIDDEHDLGHGILAAGRADPESAQRQPTIRVRKSRAHV
jgi:hypothetical protein